jgi:peptide/nickel transport system substrate-binding protein
MSGKSDFYPGVTMPQLKDVKSQAPQAVCQIFSANVGRNLLVNREAPPFDNADLRRAMSLTLDRKSFIDIITAGEGEIGGAMQPAPSGLWGMPADMLKTLPGYDPDIQKNRAQARNIMEKLGYGPDKRRAITVSTRNIAGYRDPAVIVIDQLKEIYFDAQLDTLDTTQWYPKIMRRDYKVGINVTETAVDDPDPVFTRTMSAALSETTQGIAILWSTKWSMPSRRRAIFRSASGWCGRSKRNWWRTTPGRPSSILKRRVAGNRGLRA